MERDDPFVVVQPAENLGFGGKSFSSLRVPGYLQHSLGLAGLTVFDQDAYRRRPRAEAPLVEESSVGQFGARGSFQRVGAGGFLEQFLIERGELSYEIGDIGGAFGWARMRGIRTNCRNGVRTCGSSAARSSPRSRRSRSSSSPRSVAGAVPPVRM